MSATEPGNAVAQIPTSALDLLPGLGAGVTISDDAVLALTRGLRIEALRDLHKNGTLSGEGADRNFFLGLTAGLDSQAMNNKKIAAEQKSNSSNAALMAEIIARTTPAMFAPGAGNTVVDVDAMVLPDSVAAIDTVPGETSVAPAQMDYDSFVKRNEGLVGKKSEEDSETAAQAAPGGDDWGA